MKKKYVLLSMVSHKKLTKEPYGHSILKLLYDKYPNLTPEYCNYHEPVNIPTPTFEDAYKLWNEKWFFCRRKHSVQMSASLMIGKYDISKVKLEYNWDKFTNWFSLFKDLASICKSYFSYIHVFTEQEIEIAEMGSSVYAFLNSTPGWVLRENGIP